ncbi:MAG: rRNA maturation RNase YbeY [Pricia sp.]
MIEFHYETEFAFQDVGGFQVIEEAKVQHQAQYESELADWVSRVINSEGFDKGAITYIFCADEYLWELNKKHLKHDTLTDIITFDYTVGRQVSGDIFISVDRVKENAKKYKTNLGNEILRVMSHGLLHLFGYKDKSESDQSEMRGKEDEKIKLFHVEQ